MNSRRDALSTRLRGLIVAIVTPLNQSRPDGDRLVALARHLLNLGCNGLNVLGTTGEGTSLSVEERMAVMSALAEAKLPTDRMMVGTGAAALTDAVRLSRHAAVLGFGGILLLPPFYYKEVLDAGIVAYARAIIDSTSDAPVPIYLYNFPALSGVAYSVPVVAELVRQFGPRIAGLKDSSRDVVYAKEVAAISQDLDVFCVSEVDIPAVRAGDYAGIISGVANASAGDCVWAFAGDQIALARAKAIAQVVAEFPPIPAIKCLLADMHRDASLAEVRPPLTSLTPDEAATLRARFSAVAADR